MPTDTDSDGRSADTVDRILVVLCAAIWLAFLGMAVAATVQLVKLGRGHPDPGSGSGTPWLLYGVIGVSALVIVAAVPLLIRARRTALAETGPSGRPVARTVAPAARSGAERRPPAVPRATEAPTEKLRMFGQVADPMDRGRRDYPDAPARSASGWDGSSTVLPAAALDRLWLRSTAVLLGAIGAALFAVAAATYLMAAQKDGTAWMVYGVAGVFTLAMPVIPWLYLRTLRRALDERDVA
jgi:hypothetical protein